MYWEPGVTVSTGRQAVSFNFPIGYYYNRFRNPYTGSPGDSTFPEYVSIATYAVRLGRTHAKHPIMTDATATGADAPKEPAKQPKEKDEDKDPK